MKKVKKIFNADDVPVDEPVEVQTKVKLSNSKAKGLAKKYSEIDDLEERAFQILVDLKMVGRS